MMRGGATIEGLRTVPSRMEAVTLGSRGALPAGKRSAWIQPVSVNILVSLFYGVFLYSSLKFWFSTGSLVSIGLVASNTLLVTFFLVRRTPTILSESIRNWFVALMAQILPLLLRPTESASWLRATVSSAGQVLGLAIMIASLVALNRSIGIVAANRGIKTRGLYAFIRHPLYAGEITFFFSFLVAHWTTINAALVVLLIMSQVVRSVQEEELLLRDEAYQSYRARVRYRMIPGVF